jgi:enediyne biosynthesis protein E4
MRMTRRNLLALLGAAALPAQNKPLFEEVPASASGITWTHTNAMSPDRYLPETLPPGCAFLDYDNDGWMDIFLVNTGPSNFYKPKQPLHHALYKNNRDGTFTDVTSASGIPVSNSFGQGVAAADFMNSGYPGILITAYGPPTLLRNNGNGTFTDITATSGLAIPELTNGWTTSAVWFDYDNDGKLDLFLCSFVQYGQADRFSCGDNSMGRKYYCVPRVFKPTASFLFHNNGDGTFKLVSKGTDIDSSLGKALGVVATDVNNDGLMDLFVANDTVQNFLFMNRGKGKWEEVGLAAEVAFSGSGQPRSGMGVDAFDVNNDGWQDLFVANVDQEMFSLYQNNKNESFLDTAHKHSVAQATRLLSGWGLKFFDYDNDGWVDAILSNGHPDDMIEQYSQQVKYKEPLLLFHNTNGVLKNISATAGPVFQKSYPSRGLAVGDFNNDGRLDVLVANNGEAPLLLRNNSSPENRWVGLKLVGRLANRDAIGARIVWSVDGKKFARLKNNGGSYLSSHDPREVLGLGPTGKLDYVEIHWPRPSTQVQRLTNLEPGKYHTINEPSA